MSIQKFTEVIPKAELHVHIEGTFEPELMFEIASRNNISLQYNSVEDLKNAYNFTNLQSFLDIYYSGAKVLINEQDFYDLTLAYLEKAHSQNVLHTEIMFDPQTHTNRGVEFKTVISGITNAMKDAKSKLGITSNLIMCFLRHLSEADAIKTLKTALDYKDLIVAVGLDSSEKGHPPSKFKRVFEMALKEGFKTVAHAGEEGPAEYVWEALDLLKVSRIDHGNNSLDDDNLIQKLISHQIPLTVCPLSNLKLKVVTDLKMHPLKKMLDAGLLATVNSDDPAYFGGYVNENFLAVAEALKLTKGEIFILAVNSFKASFLDESSKQEMIEKVGKFFETVN
ncbi:MAG TPA: adenosine deaminase [Draconibacterium sp.]|nr:adenosine deaminase [Draconibacterium sp.]